MYTINNYIFDIWGFRGVKCLFWLSGWCSAFGQIVKNNFIVRNQKIEIYFSKLFLCIKEEKKDITHCTYVTAKLQNIQWIIGRPSWLMSNKKMWIKIPSFSRQLWQTLLLISTYHNSKYCNANAIFSFPYWKRFWP